ncbi:MAG: phosphate/sulfate permease [Thermoproteota archaeon]|jgi:phosphate/sulfate permease
MGLLYQFPSDELDQDHVKKSENSILLRSYGLPPLFWAYGAAILIVYTLIVIGTYNPLIKLMSYPDQMNQIIGVLLITFLVTLLFSFISFFFYEKNISAKKNSITLIYKLFFIPFRKKMFSIEPESSFEISAYLDSPNMAKLEQKEEMRGFQNKGYFQLFLFSNEKKILIDRSSRKADLTKMSKLLKQYLD